MVRSRKTSARNDHNLDVISIGSLYNGPWEKKYWSSSRGKDRHPYPVGYQVVRAHNGTTCKMEILEGVNGPTFLISSHDGSSTSGKTPHIAWADFQKNGFTRIKNLHRNRISSKMDALELFGFKNQVIMRMLRQLVAEPSLVSSNLSNDVSKTEKEDGSKESQDSIDIDLFVPDTQEYIYDSVPSNMDKNNDRDGAVSEGLPKSMMSLLLPQAVPSLRNNSTDDYDECVPGSDMDDMSPPHVCVPDSDMDDMCPSDVCVPESDLDEFVPDSDLDEFVPDSDLDESPAQHTLNSVQNDLPVAQDFLGGKMQDEAKIGNAKTSVISSSQSPNLVHTRRRKRRSFVTLRRNYSAVESAERDKTELVTPQSHAARDSLPPSKTIQAENDKLWKPDDSVGLILEKPEVHRDVSNVQNNPAELNLSSQNPNPFSCENKCSGGKEAQFISEPMVPKNQEVKNNLKFVGSYALPMPVSSVLLKTLEDEIHVCVLCGLLTDQHKTLFTYKVAIKEPNFGYPSFMAYTPIMLPDPKDNFTGQTMVERTGVELTPGGQFIVLIGIIKTPNCREGKIDCCCSTCTSICSKKNGLKVVRVESGYVSVVATLEAVGDLHCILVCEPNRLVAVGGSGSIQVWVMNSTWSEKIEYFSIPSVGIVELKRVLKCAHLVVGRNIYGDFSLWDITKLNCVSSFSASKYPINEFLPISLFHLQTKGLSHASVEEKAEQLLEASEFWRSKQRESRVFLPTEDVAMWFLVSTPSDFDCCQDHVSTSIHHDVLTARRWRLALLLKNSIVFGSLLDPRTTAVGVSGGYGIFSTSDGAVYMWDLSRGSKLDILHYLPGDTITSIVTDDLNSKSSIVGVAGENGQLLLYLHHNRE